MCGWNVVRSFSPKWIRIKLRFIHINDIVSFAWYVTAPFFIIGFFFNVRSTSYSLCPCMKGYILANLKKPRFYLTHRRKRKVPSTYYFSDAQIIYAVDPNTIQIEDILLSTKRGFQVFSRTFREQSAKCISIHL